MSEQCGAKKEETNPYESISSLFCETGFMVDFRIN